MSIVLRFFPNGEFTQGYLSPPKEKKDRASLRSPHMCDEYHRMDALAKSLHTWGERRDAYLQWWESIADMQGDEYWSVGSQFEAPYLGIVTIDKISSDTFTYRRIDSLGVERITECALPLKRAVFELNWLILGSSSARILTEPKTSRKRCPAMTRSMGRNIRSACYMLEHKYTKSLLSFLTLTLPSLSKSDLGIICDNWDTCVHNFFKWLRTKTEAHGFPLEYVYCTEVQSKRLHNRGEYAPHLHIVFRGREKKKSPWAISPKMARKAWGRILRSFVSEPFDDSALENLQVIRKSASRYLAKYLSKSKTGDTQSDVCSDTPQIKTHWGGISRRLRQELEQAKVYICGRTYKGYSAYEILHAIDGAVGLGCVAFWRRTYIQFGGDDGNGHHGIHVGYGRLARPILEGGLDSLIRYMDSTESCLGC